MDNRIQIKIEEKIIVDGRWEIFLKNFYQCWCTTLELYGKELYESQNIKLENVLVFKVRYCKKIKSMKSEDKNKFKILFDSSLYQVYQVDFKSNSKNWVYIKAKMVI